MEQSFDEAELEKSLCAMTFAHKLLFGCACAERLLPNYSMFKKDTGWGSEKPLRDALDMAWEACLGTLPTETVIGKSVSDCESAIPDSEDFRSLYTSFAQDAVFSVCNILDFLSDRSVDHVVAVARHATDTVDLYVQVEGGLVPLDAEREEKILQHPLMQQELQRQNAALLELNGCEVLSVGFVNRVKLRSASQRSFVVASV